MEKLAASVVCYTARPFGLTHVLKSIAKQEFHSWEFVLVDAHWHEREEMVSAWWSEHTTVPLVHVPPLQPIARTSFHAWDIPLFQHTGWCYARGQVVVQIEDFDEVLSPTWLKRHAEFVTAHPNLITIGDVVHEDGGSHFGHKAAEEMLVEWKTAFPDLTARYENPKQLGYVNAGAYGFWLSGNTGFWLEHILRAEPFLEIPTHYPEATNIPKLFEYGLSMWPLTEAALCHHSHPGTGGPPLIAIERNVYQNATYLPVKQEHFQDIKDQVEAWRHITPERKRLRRWT